MARYASQRLFNQLTYTYGMYINRACAPGVQQMFEEAWTEGGEYLMKTSDERIDDSLFLYEIEQSYSIITTSLSDRFSKTTKLNYFYYLSKISSRFKPDGSKYKILTGMPIFFPRKKPKNRAHMCVMNTIEYSAVDFGIQTKLGKNFEDAFAFLSKF